jgi:hypothetical protein
MSSVPCTISPLSLLFAAIISLPSNVYGKEHTPLERLWEKYFSYS